MSYFGMILLARSDSLLVQVPQVKAAFGSHWRLLEDRGDGWQLLDIGPPWPHQWPTVPGRSYGDVVDFGVDRWERVVAEFTGG
jgi:hypothetical protein